MMEDLGLPSMNQFNVRSAGHEGAGVVVKVGRDVKNWKVGDRGGVKPVWDVCGECDLCWDGMHETYCPKAVLSGLAVPGELMPQTLASFHHMRDSKVNTELIKGHINNTLLRLQDIRQESQIMWTTSLQGQLCVAVQRYGVALVLMTLVSFFELTSSQIYESQLRAGNWAVFPGGGGGVGHM
jgi:hypothetical protein